MDDSARRAAGLHLIQSLGFHSNCPPKCDHCLWQRSVQRGEFMALCTAWLVWKASLKDCQPSRLLLFLGKSAELREKGQPGEHEHGPFFLFLYGILSNRWSLTCESASIILSPWLRPASTSCLHLKMHEHEHEHEHEREAAFSHLRRIQIKRIRCQTNPYRAIQAIAHLNCGRTCSVCGS